MKLTHIVWTLQTGGVETMLVNIINEQVKTEKVELIITNDLYYIPLVKKISPLCKVHFCRRIPGSCNPLPIIKLNYWLWRFSPDIVHLHSYKSSYLIKGHYNMVRTIHSTRNYCKEYPRMKALFAISESVKKETLKQGFDSVVVENGIPCDLIRRKNDYMVKDNIFHFVQVSRLDVSSKGQDYLVEAVNLLVNQRGITNFRLTFVGEGESRDELEKMISNYHLQDFFYFEGQRPQAWIFEHLADYDCFLQPSRYEGFGLTVAEAMAAGLPVLVSDIEGPMEVIDFGRVGMYFKAGDVESLTDRIAIILQGGYDYSLIDKAYQRVCEKYDVAVTAKKYIEEYRKLLK